MKTLKVNGCEIQVLSDKVRDLNIQGVVYHVIDVYISNQGAASVFLNDGQSFSDLSGFVVGVYKNRMSVVPIFRTAGQAVEDELDRAREIAESKKVADVIK